MFCMPLIITFISFAFSLISALDGGVPIPEEDAGRTVVVNAVTASDLELNSAQLISIGKAMTTCYQEFLKSRTVQLPKTSNAFDFFVHKKGKKYKIPKDGCIDLLLLERFLGCLSEDITQNEALQTGISELHTKFANGNITQKVYTKTLQEYGVQEESDVEQYLKSISHHLEKIKIVNSELNILKAQENAMRLKDLTFEMALGYLTEDINSNPIIRNLAKSYIRENFSFTE